jgi:predicted NUDIX family NTP pyrophosphohydrolase
MAKQSAGLLLYRVRAEELQVFLVHPGGPFFIRKDEGWWTVPKGEPAADEDLLCTAIREFEEETGYRPAGEFISLQPVIQKGGKKVSCWAVSGDLDPETVKSNEFQIEWPPKSGSLKYFPEIDRAAWFTVTAARKRINEKQVPLLEELVKVVSQ